MLKKIKQNFLKNQVTMMKINKNFIIKIIFILISFFWFIFSLYLIFPDRALSNIYITIFFYIMFLIQCLILYRKSNFFIIKKLYELLNDIKEYTSTTPINVFFENIFQKVPYIGDILIYLCKYFNKCCKYFGKFWIKIFTTLLFIMPQILLSFTIFFNIFFNTKYYYLLIFCIFYSRISLLLVFLLNDFSYTNKVILKNYLIIEKKNSQIIFKLNENTVIHKTQEKLDLFSARFLLFDETYFNINKITSYFNLNIKPYISSFIFSIIFSCSLKIIFISYITNDYIFIPVIIFVFFKELNNHANKNENIP